MSGASGRKTPPKLHGDGIHDDTDALQWYVDHGVPVPEDRVYRVNFDRLKLPKGGRLGLRVVEP